LRAAHNYLKEFEGETERKFEKQSQSWTVIVFYVLDLFGNYLELFEQGCTPFPRQKSPTVNAMSGLDWPVNSICKESEIGSTNSPATLVI
jgi:hypothetical protein